MEQVIIDLSILIGGLWIVSHVVNTIGRFLISLFETLVKFVSAIVVIYSLLWLVNNLELFIRY
ncbi:hypothetical protein [Candidatus Viridilinea mediisalina]|uniref:Uncharacterized protein n=1 Tax=Candidatus Viridilinea mediisalina TaxID=2024553 RepID=A0A2A6RHG8_9CHLR|nr:hypothetical protein [Candidatus Viridilinea mediisalina]PDW02318.1 hypothetical protein CJ255_14625 [Candidatus Viridilinea mediisalina]